MKSKALIITLFIILTSHLIAQELPIKDLEKVVQVPEQTLQRYTGHYKIEAMSLTLEVVTDKGELYAIVAGMGKLALSPGTQTAFAVKDIQAQLEFSDIQEKAQKIRLYQAGAVLEGKRIPAPKELDYESITVGSAKIDYDKVYTPFESEWDLVINDRTVGAATVHLRHALYKDKPAYHAGSIIRYTSMGNRPFADMGFFAKADYTPLQARNAISQEDEILSTTAGNTVKQVTMNMYTGKVSETKTVTFDQPVFGGGIYKLLSMELTAGMTVQFPVSGFTDVAWEKALVAEKETLSIEGFDQPFETWRIEYSSGTIKWIMDQAPYLIKWQMPTGMQWNLKSFVK